MNDKYEGRKKMKNKITESGIYEEFKLLLEYPVIDLTDAGFSYYDFYFERGKWPEAMRNAVVDMYGEANEENFMKFVGVMEKTDPAKYQMIRNAIMDMDSTTYDRWKVCFAELAEFAPQEWVLGLLDDPSAKKADYYDWIEEIIHKQYKMYKDFAKSKLSIPKKMFNKHIKPKIPFLKDSMMYADLMTEMPHFLNPKNKESQDVFAEKSDGKWVDRIRQFVIDSYGEYSSENLVEWLSAQTTTIARSQFIFFVNTIFRLDGGITIETAEEFLQDLPASFIQTEMLPVLFDAVKERDTYKSVMEIVSKIK